MDINDKYDEEFMSVTAVNLTYNGKNSPTSTHNSVVLTAILAVIFYNINVF